MSSTVGRTIGLARRERGRLALAVLAGVLAAGCALGLLATSAWLISRAAQQPPVVALSLAVVAVRAFAIGRAGLRYAERLASHDAALRTLSDVRVVTYRRLERLAPSGLAAFRSGDLLRRVVADVDGMADVFLRGLLPYVVSAVLGCATAAALLFLLTPAALALLAGLVVLGVLLPLAVRRLSARAERGVVTQRAALAAGVVATMDGLPDLVAYEAAEQRVADLLMTDRELARELDRSARWSGFGQATTMLTIGLLVWVMALVAVPAVRDGRLAGVALGLVVLLPLGLADTLGSLPVAAQEVARSAASARRVFAVLDAAEPVREPAEPVPLPQGPYRLEVRGLRVRWPGAATPALDEVDLDLSPGRRVAVVGPSGSGKTTLAYALLRFLDADAGSISLNGVSTADLVGDDVRSVVGLVTEDAHLFDSTLWENLRLARPDATREDVRAALARARLLDWAESLPAGLDTPAGARGAELSGGQRQRLALARALLAEFPMIVLDEPAEHLDAATGDALIRDLLAATSEVGTLLITHRLTGLAAVDEILVLDRGRVVERGRHADLLARPGPYHRMWQLEQEA